MDLSSVNLQGRPTPPLPPVVTGTVEAVHAPGRYSVNVQGMLFELEMNLFMALGDRVSLRVREQTAERLVFELLPREPAAAAAPRERADAVDPNRPEVREFVRMRAPLDPVLLDRAARLARDVPTRQAAAFLAGHGIEPTRELVDLLARLSTLLPSEPRTDAAMLRPLADALQGMILNDPADVPVKAPLLAGPPPGELEAAVQRLLQATPRLQSLDRLIQAVQAAVPQTLPEAESRAAMESVLSRLSAGAPPETDLPAMSRGALRELLSRLLEIERQEIRAMPELAEARAAQGTAIEAADRMAALRLVNQLSTVRNDGIHFVEIPVRADGKVQYIPLRIVREGAGKGSGAAGGAVRFTLHLDADLTQLGPVRARMDLAGRGLGVLFRVRDAAVRDHLERGAGQLAEALRAAGLEASVRAEVAPPEPRESIFDVFAAPGDPTTIDVQA